MKLEVRLFAVARQLVGADSLAVEVPRQATIGQLRAAMAREIPALAPLLSQMLFAIGNEYVADDTVIVAGADIACIPPVSGG